MSSITKQQLENASADAETLEEVINGASSPGVVISRLGQTIRTLAKAMNDSWYIAYQTKALLDADLAHAENTLAHVTNDSNTSDNGLYIKVGASGAGSWLKSNYDRVTAVETIANETQQKMGTVLSTTGKNLLDKSQIRAGYAYSFANNNIGINTNYRVSGFIPVEAGKTYTVSGQGGSAAGMGWYAATTDANSIGESLSDSAVAPEGANFAVVNVTSTGQNDTTHDDTVQFEEGEEPTAYEAYDLKISAEKIRGTAIVFDDVLEYKTFNLIDPSACNYTSRYSTSTKSFTTDTLGIAASDWIHVEEGVIYTLSGAYYSGKQGGFFTSYGAVTALSNISFITPPNGIGTSFQVPTGQGITHAVVSLSKLNNLPASTTLNGDVQLEQGEVATDYQAYNPVPKVKTNLLSTLSGSSSSSLIDSESWYKFVISDGVNSFGDKLPLFRSHWLKRDKDLCVVNTGTSLTARSDEHCTSKADASERPPLMHSNNLASILWDRMEWDGQKYRRYDSSGFFTESGGSFATSYNLAEWDDGAYRAGYTRYCGTTGAAVSFTIPINAWQFNFIYRTDTTGVVSNLISVGEGNGKLEVWNGSAWVEANGFTFSMRESAPVTRTVSVPSPSTDTFSNYTIASKGNTTYQKRLKMRCKSSSIDSRSVTKAVTITGQTAGRFMYWGVEWSPREFMITYINAARGSHNTQASSSSGLPRFQDNEIWSFNPDLLFFELPIHNDGVDSTTAFAAGYWSRLTNNFVFRSDYELSLVSRGTHFGLSPEIGMFTSSISWNFGGIESDGTLKYNAQADGSMMTSLDKYNQAFEWVLDNHPEVVMINSVKRWVDAAIAIHGNLKTATEGSGKDGLTFTNEGSHWNDTGSKIIGKTLAPLFHFTS